MNLLNKIKSVVVCFLFSFLLYLGVVSPAYASSTDTVAGSFQAVGQVISFSVAIPESGGSFQGTFNGACSGSINGNYNAGNNNVSGNASGSCSFLTIQKSGNFNFQGSVDLTNKKLTVTQVTRPDGSTPGSLTYAPLPMTTDISVNNNSSSINDTQTVQGNPTQNISNLTAGQTYSLFQGSIKFTSLPTGSNSIDFRQVGVSGGAAYELTSNMSNGTFTYDLTLPLPTGTNNFIVKYAPTTGDLGNAQLVTQPITNNGDGTITIHGLNHFTIFVVDTNPSSVACLGAGSNCYTTVQAAIDAASSGDTINIQSGTYKENVKVTKSLTLIGVNSGSGIPSVTQIVIWSSGVTISNINSSVVEGRPSATLTNPVNNSNKTNTSITGTGLANANLSYSISDGVHPAVTGTGVVSAGGSISISGINLSSLNDGSLTLTLTLNDGAGHTSSSATANSFKDTVAPAAPTATIATYINASGASSVSISGTGEAGSTAHYSISDGVHSAIAGTVTVNSSGNWSVSSLDLSGLNDGSITLSIYLTDSAGNQSSTTTSTSTKDTVAPTASAGSNKTTKTIFNSVSNGTSASDPSPSSGSLTYQWSGAAAVVFSAATSLSTNISATADGTYTITLTVTDPAGNSTVRTFTLVWDTTNPTASVSNSFSPDGTNGWYKTNPTITLNVSDSLSGLVATKVRYIWDAVATASNGTTFTNGTTINIPSDGNHTLSIYAEDNAGNSVNPSFNYKLDTVDPTATITGNSTNWQNSVPTITVGATDATSSVATATYSWDGGASVSTSNGSNLQASLAALADGTHTLSLTVTDNAGRLTTVTGTYKIDRVNPTNPGIPNTTTPTNSTNQTWTWAASTDATSGVAFYLLSIDGAASTNIGNVTTYSTTLTQGTHTFAIQAEDNAGNLSSVKTGQVVVDTQAPGTTASGIDTLWHKTSVTVTLNCTDNLSGCKQIIYTTDGSDPVISATRTVVNVSGLSASTSFTLSAEGVYTIKYYSIDQASNQEGTNQAANTVRIDTTNPTASVSNSFSPDGTNGWYKTNPTITLHGSDTLSGLVATKVRYAWDSTATATNGTIFVDGNTINIPSQGTHTLSIYVEDNAGNSYTLPSVTYKLDTTIPVTSAVTLTNGTTGNNSFVKNGDTVTLTATITDNNQSLITVSLITADLSALGGGTAVHPTSYNTATGLATWASLVVSGAGNGVVTITVNANDFAGNAATAQSVSPTSDNTVPTTPGTPATTTPTKLTTQVWNWTVSTDGGSGINYYQVSIDGGAFTNIGNVLTYTTNLTQGNHTFTVRAVDNAGNVSTTASGSVLVDITAPTGSWTTPSAGAIVSGTVTLTVSASDNLTGVASVAFLYKRNDGVDTFHTITTLSSSPYTTSWNTSGLALDNYTLRITITDGVGNTTSVDEIVGLATVISSSSIQTSNVGNTTAVITWTTADPTGSRVIYDTISHSTLGSAPNYGYASSTANFDTVVKVLNHSVTLTGLLQSTTYYYRTVSSGSPEAVSAELSFTTANASGSNSSSSSSSSNPAGPAVCGDGKPGSAPTLLSAIANGLGRIVLTWSKAKDPVSYYLLEFGTASGVYKYGSPNIGGANTASYAVGYLQNGVKYYFRVRAVNGCTPGDPSNEVSAFASGTTPLQIVTQPVKKAVEQVLGETTVHAQEPVSTSTPESTQRFSQPTPPPQVTPSLAPTPKEAGEINQAQKTALGVFVTIILGSVAFYLSRFRL